METTLRLHRLYQSGMVLLQKTDNCISGYAEPYASVTVAFRDRIVSATADDDGAWELFFAAGSAGGPYELTVTASSKDSFEPAGQITLTDVYVGEVWVGSGQSNMQVPLERLKYSYPEDYAAPENKYMRFFTVPIEYGFDGPHADLNGGQWVSAGPENTPALAGTAYFFTKTLWQNLKVPVGFINASQGGSPITSWLSEEAVSRYPAYKAELDQCRDEADVERRKQAHARQNDEWMEALNAADAGLSGGWKAAGFPAGVKTDEAEVPGRYGRSDFAGAVWFKKTFDLTADELELCRKNGAGIWLGRITDADTTYINGTEVGGVCYQYPPRRYDVPAEALKEGRNEVTVRVISNGVSGGIEFASEKRYVFFAGTALEPLFEKQLGGVWQCAEGYSTGPGGGDFFPEWCATALYNKMLAPLIKTAVRGFVWYQGEANTGKSDEYESLLKDLISQVRHDFRNAPDAARLPFIIAQLPNCGPKDMCSASSAAAIPGGWTRMREVQASVADSTLNAGLAVLLDSGEWNDLHPENKFAVGFRLGNEALRIAYDRDIARSPRFKTLSIEGREITLHFETGNSPLMAGSLGRMEATAHPLEKGTVLGDFATVWRDTAGNRMVVRAKAHISGADTVVLEAVPPAASFAVSDFAAWKLAEIRCLWASSPDSVTLYNSDGIPVCPFRVRL